MHQLYEGRSFVACSNLFTLFFVLSLKLCLPSLHILGPLHTPTLLLAPTPRTRKLYGSLISIPYTIAIGFATTPFAINSIKN
jgi:hypothetical protein